jgi:N-acetylglucosaminyldiphosphoundecaprenol N-acetyl-beta-D-mannosaminyltransferase
MKNDFITALSSIVTSAPTDRAQIIGHLNAYAIYWLRKNKDFANAMQSFDFIFCDGYGAALALFADTGHWPHRHTYAEFLKDWLAALQQMKQKVFILGYSTQQLECILKAIRIYFPDLNICGYHHGFFDHKAHLHEIHGKIREASPDVVFIGMGMPTQELIATQMAKELKGCTIMPLGAGFLYLAGLENRGPRLLTENGFEWACRLFYDPKRLALRTLKSNFSLTLYILQLLYGRLRLCNKSGLTHPPSPIENNDRLFIRIQTSLKRCNSSVRPMNF